jgi:hypothetical protein
MEQMPNNQEEEKEQNEKKELNNQKSEKKEDSEKIPDFEDIGKRCYTKFKEKTTETVQKVWNIPNNLYQGAKTWVTKQLKAAPGRIDAAGEKVFAKLSEAAYTVDTTYEKINTKIEDTGEVVLKAAMDKYSQGKEIVDKVCEGTTKLGSKILKGAFNTGAIVLGVTIGSIKSCAQGISMGIDYIKSLPKTVSDKYEAMKMSAVDFLAAQEKRLAEMAVNAGKRINEAKDRFGIAINLIDAEMGIKYFEMLGNIHEAPEKIEKWFKNKLSELAKNLEEGKKGRKEKVSEYRECVQLAKNLKEHALEEAKKYRKLSQKVEKTA